MSSSSSSSAAGGSGKRKAPSDEKGSASKKPRAGAVKAKGKIAQGDSTDEWPEYFVSLYKTYKALNTVVAFCSSRKALATTFPVVRASVEGIIKRPLELARVAEIKALLPDIVSFAYIPASHHRINDTAPAASSSSRSSRSSRDRDDVYEPRDEKRARAGLGLGKGLNEDEEEEEHVLVMEFADNTNTSFKKNMIGYSMPVQLTPQAVKALIEKRNTRFVMAVNELIEACKPTSEDPEIMLQVAGSSHIPINPSLLSSSSSTHPLPSQPPIPPPPSRPSIPALLTELSSAENYRDQIIYRRSLLSRPAQFGELNKELSPEILRALEASKDVPAGEFKFYKHQAEAINAFWGSPEDEHGKGRKEGKNVVVSTATASGKSVIYQVPTLCALMDEEDPEATAMFVYPTKALAQDQLSSLSALIALIPSLSNAPHSPHSLIATYDGDTPLEKRAGIRDTARIIFTNFDMIHAGILPGEERWRRFLKGLRIVVVDELHYYDGLMGSHVALVMRRFRRVCAAVGNRRVRFISCSATISNPAKHMTSIFGVDDVAVITEDGSPSGPKESIIWQPPYIDSQAPELGRVRSLLEGVRLFVFLMMRGVRTIVFCKIRRTCEMFMKTVRAELLAQGRSDIEKKVRAYRSGYSQEDRRAIEREAFSGNLMGLVATNALELGVDIGSLDAVISLGFPYSVSSFRQQSGRAGRRARDSLSVLISDNLPIDRHYLANPDDIYDKETAGLIIDVENKVILESHLQCAAHEMPIQLEEDQIYFGPLLQELSVKLEKDKEGWYHTHRKYLPHPAKHVSLRGAREDKYTIVDVTNVDKPNGRARILEELEFSRALFEAYEGGVFMHQGRTYIVKEVSHDERTAKIIRSDVNWTTRPRDFTNIDATQTHRIREIRGSPQHAYYGRVDIVTIIFGFFKLRHNVILDTVQLETPPFERESTGMWVDVPKAVLELLFRKGMNPAEGIHSAQHAVLSLTPLFSMSTARDIRTECKVAAKENMEKESSRKRPGRLIFYDAAGSGGGICAKAFDHMTEMLEQALSVIENCDCEDDDGCASCIQLASCKEGNTIASKLGAKVILQGVLGRPVDLDHLPDIGIFDVETIVPATTVKALGDVQIEPDATKAP